MWSETIFLKIWRDLVGKKDWLKKKDSRMRLTRCRKFIRKVTIPLDTTSNTFRAVRTVRWDACGPTRPDCRELCEFLLRFPNKVIIEKYAGEVCLSRCVTGLSHSPEIVEKMQVSERNPEKLREIREDRWANDNKIGESVNAMLLVIQNETDNTKQLEETHKKFTVFSFSFSFVFFSRKAVLVTN